MTVDLAVIGGGFTGLSAALGAAGQGARVAVLEARQVGHGGSGRNVGLVNAGLWLPPEGVRRVMGQEAGERLNRALAGGPDLVFDLIERHGIACEPQRAGTLHCAHSARGLADLEDRYRQMKVMNAPVTLLDGDRTQARTGARGVYGALHDARAGTIQPLAYARGLARAAREAGARIFEQSPVIEARWSGRSWHVRTAEGSITARRLLNATNAYQAPTEGVALPAVPVVNFFQLATEPVPGLADKVLPGGEGCWDTGLIMTSFRRDLQGRLILGAIGLPERGGSLHHDWARRKLRQLFPDHAGAALSHAWSGRISMTSDHVPKAMRLEGNGLAIFGYSGRGIAPGTLLGRAAAQALLGDDDEMLPLPVTERMGGWFSGSRSLYYEAGARLVHFLGARR
ncbi:FAD-dependent oxidoreductase [Aquicoccus sp. SCR17]|nr:FAD-dependent oxidoreductase [Carideicomes alvinocaridis]